MEKRGRVIITKRRIARMDNKEHNAKHLVIGGNWHCKKCGAVNPGANLGKCWRCGKKKK